MLKHAETTLSILVYVFLRAKGLRACEFDL
jgi:hypothetical protein